MPIKDIIRIFECKYCKKKFTMFEKSDGELVYFPENVMWPVHGDFELASHLKMKHRHNYDRDRTFYTDEELIKRDYHKVKPDEEIYMQVLQQCSSK